MSRAAAAFLFALVSMFGAIAGAQDREAKVRSDRASLADDDTWIYNDLKQGFREAKRTDKPLMIVLRCIPCEACSQFDKRLLASDNEVRDLLDDFVCVRVINANGLDLSLFQFDYDQSFHVMFLAADQTIYGRFGTRSDRPESDDMTMAGLREAMLGALDLHKNREAVAELLAGKRGPRPLVETPEEYASLKGKYDSKINFEGNVVQSCIHCHQVREAERLTYRAGGDEIPEKSLFPFPLPETIGLWMDPTKKATVKKVGAETIAAEAGLQPGDEIKSLGGQPLLSIADLQWVLHNADGGDKGLDKLAAVVQRDGKSLELTLNLSGDWRTAGDISWRATTWDLRRLGSGGLVLEPVEYDMPIDVDDVDPTTLRVKYVGEYGEHAAGKHAGFRRGDVFLSVDDGPVPPTEGLFLRQILKKPRGAKTAITVLRGSEKLKLTLPVQ